MTIEIWKPLMMAGNKPSSGVRKVSLAVHKVMQEGDVVKMQIIYRRKDKSLLHANPFLISKAKALTFPKTTIKGVTCVTIPLHEFKEDVLKAEPPIIIKVEPQSKIPTKPCWACGSTKFAKMPWAYICVVCHPSPNPDIVEEIIDVAEKARL